MSRRPGSTSADVVAFRDCDGTLDPVENVVRAAQDNWSIVQRCVNYRPRLGASKVAGTWRGSVQAVRAMSAVPYSPDDAARLAAAAPHTAFAAALRDLRLAAV